MTVPCSLAYKTALAGKQENTEQEIILIEEYCEKGKQDDSDETILWYMYEVIH